MLTASWRWPLFAAPLLVLAGMAATPWETENTTAAYHDALAGHPDQAEIVAMLLHFGLQLLLLLLPASLGLMHIARGAGPRLAHVGGLLVTDFYDLALAQALPISDAAQGSWAAAVLGISGAFPVVIGIIVLAVAAWRAGTVPGAAALLVAAGWIVPFASAGGLVLDAVGGALMSLGLGWMGLIVARMSDQVWAERAFVRTTRAKAPKMAVESAA